MEDKILNIGIVGSGMIVPVFINAAKKIAGYHIRAIWGRNEERLKELKNEYHIGLIYTDYNDLLNDKKIDAVYIALSNSLHHEYAKKALNAGKNVILEKPFTATYKQAKELIKIAEKKELLIFEAITTMYLPNYLKTKEFIDSLGNIKIAILNYSHYSSRYDAFKEGNVLPLFDNKMAGGALMDLNIYNIYFLVGLFGKPKKVKYYPNIQKNIDTSGILIMEYPSFIATCIGAEDCEGKSSIVIEGDNGVLSSNYPANYYQEFEVKFHKEKPITFNYDEEYSFHYELSEFLRLYRENDIKKCQQYNELTLEVMNVVNMATNGYQNVLPSLSLALPRTDQNNTKQQ